jgi:hypothetical protein
LLAALASTIGCKRDVPAAGPRLLVVTHTTGFRHSSIATAEETLAALARESGLFQVDFCRSAADVQTKLSPAGLAAYEAVFFANTTGDLGIPDLGAFLRWVEAGRAFLGAHSASDTYHGAPAFLDMLGGEFLRHGAQAEAEIRVEDASHPSVAHLAPAFRIFDELYEFRENPRSRVQVLLSMNRHPADGHAEAGQPGDFPLAWWRAHGRGRVFYTALGHREEVWQDPRFRQHLLGAIRWALGR